MDQRTKKTLVDEIRLVAKENGYDIGEAVAGFLNAEALAQILARKKYLESKEAYTYYEKEISPVVTSTTFAAYINTIKK